MSVFRFLCLLVRMSVVTGVEVQVKRHGSWWTPGRLARDYQINLRAVLISHRVQQDDPV